jgi:hypothetical protein
VRPRAPSRRGVVTLATLVLTAGALSAAAAERQKKRPGRFRVGPIYLTPKLVLKNAGVDTNVFNQRTGEISDTSVVLSPTLAGALPVGRRLRLTGEAHVDLNYFQREHTERSTDFGGEGRAEVDVGPLTLFGEGGGGHSRQRFTTDIDQRVPRHERWGAAGVKFVPSPRLSATVSGMGRIYEFASTHVQGIDVKESLDRNELTGTVQVRYALSGLTTLVASADAIEDRFLRQTRAASRLTRSYRYLAGFEFGEKALLRGKIMAGVREFPASGAAPSYFGPALAVSTTMRILRYGLLAVAADRNVYYALSPVVLASDGLRNTYVATHLGGELTVGLPLSLIGRGSFGLDEAKYLLPYPRGDAFAPRVDHLWTAGASLLRSFGNGVRIGGTIQWGRRVSSFPEFSYEGFRYGVQAEIVP